MIENLAEQGDSIKYLAEDTQLHRSVAIRVLPQSSEQQIERAQRRKQAMAFGAAGLGALLALVFAFPLAFLDGHRGRGAPAPVCLYA